MSWEGAAGVHIALPAHTPHLHPRGGSGTAGSASAFTEVRVQWGRKTETEQVQRCWMREAQGPPEHGAAPAHTGEESPRSLTGARTLKSHSRSGQPGAPARYRRREGGGKPNQRLCVSVYLSFAPRHCKHERYGPLRSPQKLYKESCAATRRGAAWPNG